MTNESVFASERVTIVGVLNLTPDSFSDGGRFCSTAGGVDVERVVAAGETLVRAGAHVLDVGGESTRPGSREVPAECEIERVEAACRALAMRLDVPISIDTRKAAVARVAVAAGARLINDVSGLANDESLAEVAAESGCLLVLGHMRGMPETMQSDPCYDDVLEEVATELERSIVRARRAGVPSTRLVVDPGIGFGKRQEDNLQLIAHCGWMKQRLGLPLLIGPSRKAFLGALTNEPLASRRDRATQAACAVAAFCRADGVRVHDVEGARISVAIGRALGEARRKGRA